MNQAEILITGANGQLGRALQAQYPKAQAVDIDELDVSDPRAVDRFNWDSISIILNAAAYTNVDGAETPDGQKVAEAANARAPANLARVAQRHDMTLVHISTDYVFDGSKNNHTEDEPFSPISVYGRTKAAGDQAVASVPKHYILRTSWVIGEGKNFVRTMLELGQKGVDPSVVNDQIGRLTFTSELVRAIDHLLTTNSPCGTYNVSNEGEAVSWADITHAIYKEAGLANTVTEVSTDEYNAGNKDTAPRPHYSTLDLTKIKATGFKPRDWRDDLHDYIKEELQ